MKPVNFILRSYKKFVKLQLNKTHLITKERVKLEKSIYIDDDISNVIESTIKHGNLYTFRFANIETKLTISNASIRIERFLLFYTCYLIYMFSKIQIRELKTLNITLVYYDRAKRLPSELKVDLHPVHVNSGLTVISDSDASVIVYRKEEMIKVLTHEMIHAFGLDAKTIPVYDEYFINTYFGIECKSVTLNESFTDALACLINTTIYTYLERPVDFGKRFASNLLNETCHIIKQAEKVLVHNGYYKLNDQIMNDRKICERTHVTSYYVVKAIIYNKIDSFLKMLKENDMKINVPIYLSMIEKNLPEFINAVRLDDDATREKNLNMSSLDILNLQIRGRKVKTI